MTRKRKTANNEALLSLLGTTDFFIFNRKFVTVLGLSREEALFFGDLISHSKNAEADGFFPYSVNHLTTSLNWDRNVQARLLKKLTRRGYITTQARGTPKRRWVRINSRKVIQDIESKQERS